MYRHVTGDVVVPSGKMKVPEGGVMISQASALAVGSIFVGALCVYGAIDQVRKGATWGATGRGWVTRDESPVYFWYVFLVRALLGPAAIFLGMFALR
jgi:hypothetical protein